jgi:hypothetical protein
VIQVSQLPARLGSDAESAAKGARELPFGGRV